ncbi:MAG: DUF1553 domain-containing protein [Planctomycetales bacterium]|nr:DUF1553 domain-containing protein [Planctomycetales bacterium]
MIRLPSSSLREQGDLNRLTRRLLAGGVGLVVALLSTVVCADDEGGFREQVAPIFARRCLSCHDSTERKGGLSLEDASALNGGDSGALVEPGDASASLLVEYVTPFNGVASMPEDSDPLSADEVAAIERWIEAGAIWPDGFRIEAGVVSDLDWWSLHPLNRPSVPTLEPGDSDIVRNEIDRFLLAKLRAEGLGFSPEADRRILIRRLYFDLIGLPPTPAEVERFVADPDPLAYEKLVDQLLDSPRYGEQWARHWLDIVQYGDSHGYDKDKPRPNAWPYRDYVIRAFNDDKPYGRFVREQLAGDRLWPDTADGIVATGFIAAGPWDFIGHAEVPESKVDGMVARNLDRDNMVSSTMNVFTSLTVQCARCHNHKFDPVTMEDYYSLQAVFAAIDRADREYDAEPSIGSRRLALQTRQQELQTRHDAIARLMEEAKPPEARELEARLARLVTPPAATVVTNEPRAEAFGYHSQVAPRADIVKWVQVDLGRPYPLDHILLFAADEYGFSDFGFPNRWKVEIANDVDFSEAELILDATDGSFPRPGSQAVDVAGHGQEARYVRITATELWSRRRQGEPLSNDWIFALGELAVVSGGKRVPVSAVTSLDSIEAAPRWSRAALIDGIYGTHPLAARVGNETSSPSNGYHSQFSETPDLEKWVQVDLGSVQAIDTIRLVPANPVDWQPATPGFGFPVRYRVELSDDPEFRAPRVILDETEADVVNPGDTAVEIPADGAAGRFVRLTATRLWDRGERHFALALSEMQVLRDDRDLARGASVDALDSIDSGLWGRDYLVDGFSSRGPLHGEVEQLLSLRLSVEREAEIVAARAELDAMLAAAIDPKLLAEQRQLESLIDEVRTELAGLPPRARVYAGTVHAGSGTFRGRAGLGPREIHVLARGEVTKPGELALPGTAPLIPGVAPRFELPSMDDEGARRVALAEWITREDNPLTWRSVVNRVWLYHFGQGIVDSPNDFGRGGQLPSHPELLDWLAVEFRDSGQSFKDLHRLICHSTAYRQGSTSHAAGETKDAGNRLLWRMNRRRLTAEEIRDGVLLLAGRLDYSMGGPGFQDFVVEHPEHSPHYEYHKYDPLDPSTHRRSVYRFIVRSQPQPFMNTLDCADPSMSVPKRDETQTALQALALLNNRFIVAMASEIARKAELANADLEAQVIDVWQRALNRDPTPDELAAVTRYARQYGLGNACRMILNLNEFVFVD